jgi:hypothetical protein
MFNLIMRRKKTVENENQNPTENPTENPTDNPEKNQT